MNKAETKEPQWSISKLELRSLDFPFMLVFLFFSIFNFLIFFFIGKSDA